MGKLYPGPTRGTWTPVLTFATPGDLSVVYSTRIGEWYLRDGILGLDFYFIATTFTHTTASGLLQITGLPFPSKTLASMQWAGRFAAMRGLTKATYTQFSPIQTSNSSVLSVLAIGSGLTESLITSVEIPTGTVKVFGGQISYPVV